LKEAPEKGPEKRDTKKKRKRKGRHELEGGGKGSPSSQGSLDFQGDDAQREGTEPVKAKEGIKVPRPRLYMQEVREKAKERRKGRKRYGQKGGITV